MRLGYLTTLLDRVPFGHDQLIGKLGPSRATPGMTVRPRVLVHLQRLQCAMPQLTVEGYGTFDVPADRRLVLAIEEAGVDVMHACGGNARCTTCRVEFIDGEPSKMTVAEKERLAARDLTGVRLSCQIICDHDMTVRAISRLEGTGRPDPGPTPTETITPPPEWN